MKWYNQEKRRGNYAMRKSTSVFLIIVVLLSSMVFACADEEEFTEYSMGIFNYSVPSSWIEKNDGDWSYYYAQDVGSTAGGYLSVHITPAPALSKSSSEEDIRASINSLANGMKKSNLYKGDFSTEDGTKNGCPLTFLFLKLDLSGTSTSFYSLLLYSNSKIFQMSLADPGLSKENLRSKFISLVDYVYTSNSGPKTFTYGNGVQFGMSIDDVTAVTGSPSSSENNTLLYENQNIAGNNANLFFYFNENGLKSILVSFSDIHSNPNSYILDFNRVDDSLVSKYGEANVSDLYNWDNDMFNDGTGKEGIAISAGYLTISSKWQIGSTVIFHVLLGENGKISHLIMYSPISSLKQNNTNGL